MKNIWLLFKGDLQRLFQNTITRVIMFGLIVIPSLFAWFNIVACWDVFDNTGNLKVAVANADAGYKSDLLPIEVNVGEQVLSELRANNQLRWVVTTEDDAIDGTRSGKYYAAVIIPETFSRDMMTFYSSDSNHATITYYSNEKKNAISPKVTDQGADKVSAEVNKVFVETLSEIGLGISSSLLQYADDTDLNGTIAQMATKISNVGDLMDNTADALDTYVSVLDVAQALVQDSGDLILQVSDAANEVISTAGDVKNTGESMIDALDSAADSITQALDISAESFDAVVASIDDLFELADTQSQQAVGNIESVIGAIDNQVQDYQALVSSLEEIKTNAPEENQDMVQSMIDSVNASIEALIQLRDALYDSANAIKSGNAQSQADREEVRALAVQAKDAIDSLRTDYDENIKPNMVYLSELINDTYGLLGEVQGSLSYAKSSLIGTSDSVASQIQMVKDDLTTASSKLKESSDELKSLGASITAGLASGAIESVRDAIGTDPSVLATALSAPVNLERHEVFPIENFGSSMTPLYTTLALWIGVLIMMVTLKVIPSRRIVETLHNPRGYQLFIGRFGAIALMSLMQSTLMCLGNIFFLHVQVANPLLCLICFWVSGLVFASIVYTLVATFANLGKAISVFLLIIQVSGGGGSYPLQLLPGFVQAISPYLPVTHAVNCMRAAMFGVCNGDFWTEIGMLLSFLIPCFIIGFILRGPLSGLIERFVEKVESTKLM